MSSAERLKPESPPGTRMHNFRADIEGLRGVAVLLVVLFHVGTPGWQGGFIGVDVFFVLSGYLITGILVQELEQTGRIGLRRFYARRIRRLLPASATILLGTMLVARIFLSPLERLAVARTGLAVAAYGSNLLFARQSADYFGADTAADPLLHTWSLAVEEQFYLVWPLLVLTVFRGTTPRRSLVGALVVVSAVSFFLCILVTKLNQPWAFFGTPLRAWEFSLGALTGLVPLARSRPLANWCKVSGWLGLGLLIVSALTYSSTTQFPGYAALVPVGGTIAILLAGATAHDGGVSRFLSAVPLQKLGRWSYSWYLWHWPPLAFATLFAPTISLPARAFLGFGSLIPAVIAFNLIENPIRFSRWLSARSRRSAGLGACITVGGLAVAIIAYSEARHTSHGPDYAAIMAAQKDMPRIYDLRCITPIRAEAPRECSFGNPAAEHTIVLFGDSHAAQWFPALEQLSQKHDWRLVTLLKPSCPTAWVAVHNVQLNRSYHECVSWRELAMQRILEIRPAAVIMANSAAYTGSIGRNPRGGHRLSTETWRAGLRHTFALLDSARVPTVLLHDNPRFPYDIPTCLSKSVYRSGSHTTQCVLSRAAVFDMDVINAEVEAAMDLKTVATVDLSSEFCPAGQCDPARGGIVLYRDSHHLAASYVASLSDLLEVRLAPLLTEIAM